MDLFIFWDVFPVIVVSIRYVPGDLSESHVVFCLLLHVHLRLRWRNAALIQVPMPIYA